MAGSLNSPLRDLIEPGDIGPVRCEGREILRRIFVTLRDGNWQEIPPTQWNCNFDESRRTATISARHTSNLVDFEWQGTLQVSDERRALRFAFEGRALRDMDVCRLGLVVLHPVEFMVGAQLTATGPQSQQQRFTVRGDLHPQPIFAGVPGAMTEPFAELALKRADLGILNLRFEGDLFELEDQRNWGDASFKSYCTPLRLGFPRAVKQGTVIAQSLEMNFTPAPEVAQPQPQVSRSGLCAAPSGRFPALGREARKDAGHPDDERAWRHLHLDVTNEADVKHLQSLLETSSFKLQIGLDAEAAGVPGEDLVALLRARQARISRLLLYGAGLAPPSAAAVDRWRRRLETPGTPQLPTLAATRGYYVEFNRAVPFDAPASGLAFPLSATVHSDDAATIVDNVATIVDMAETARQVTQQSNVVIAPLALYYPKAPSTPNFPRSLVAPWLTATLIHAAKAQVASITLAMDIVDSMPASFLARLIECAGLDVWSLEAAHSCGVHAVALGEARRPPTRLLIANLATQAGTLSLADTSLHAVRAIDAVSGKTLSVCRAGIELPPLTIAWATLAR